MLPIPPELEHLIEKRERAGDRRAQERRQEDLGLPGPGASEVASQSVTDEERRSGDRRCGKDRRGALG